MWLIELRNRVLEQIDWKPDQSTEFVSRLNRIINRAMVTLFTECPFLYEREVSLRTQADVVSNNVTQPADDLTVNSADRRVLERNTSLLIVPTGLTTFPTDNSWDGRMIEVTDPNGVVHTRRIREVWRDSDLLGTIAYDRISIEEPWPNGTDANMAFRVFTPVYYLDPSVVAIKGLRFFTDPAYEIEMITQQEAEYSGYVDWQGTTVGRPTKVYKGEPYQLPGPVEAITATEKVGTAWQGGTGEPLGEFSFFMTYVMGWRGTLTPHGLKEPLFESVPGPESARLSVTNGANSIELALPDIRWQLGFGNTLTNGISKCGIRKRIYVSRWSRVATGADVESAGVPMLLAEIAADQVAYNWRGVERPDMLRRLVRGNGHIGFRLWPPPDAAEELRLRVQYRPDILQNPYDAPRMGDDIMEALVQKALAMLYEMDGKPELSVYAEKRYGELAGVLRKRYGTIEIGKVRKKLPSVHGQQRRVWPGRPRT